MKTLKFSAMALAISLFATSCEDNDDGGNGENPNPDKKTQVYASSGSQSEISKTEYEGDKEEDAEMETFDGGSEDSDGIYYDSETDVLYQVDRSNGRLVAYSDFSANENGANLTITSEASGNAVFGGLMNGREVAKSGNKIVVAQSADSLSGIFNTFFIYEDDGSGNLTFNGVFLTSINLWGIKLDNNTMFAVEDKTNNIVVFNDFFSNSFSATVALEPDMRVSIEGIVRTHGLDYDAASDVIVMTDIGDAGDDSDGGIHIITDFKSKLGTAGDGGTIAASQQARISGSNTNLGNPVDVAYDAENDLIFVAEKANGGGRIMAFSQTDADANASPTYDAAFSGASSVHVAKEN